MKNIILVHFICICFCYQHSFSSNNELTIAFYNVENLFDTLHDPNKNDYEYLPESIKNWNTAKYSQKLKDISRAIQSINDFNGPDIIGLCEVENKNVLLDLLNNTYLNKKEFDFIHFESPDARGIDVALIYNTKKLTLLKYESHSLTKLIDQKTRDILEAHFSFENDTFQVFVNHWPSRRGGETLSQSKRKSAALLLDSLIQKNKNYLQFMIGDFNDDPFNESLLTLKNVHFNITEESYSKKCTQNLISGTLKHEKSWNEFDLILTKNDGKISHSPQFIQCREWLIEPDLVHSGTKLKRTFIQHKYEGGFSDHLPVFMIFKFN